MEQGKTYSFDSKKDYVEYNSAIIQAERKRHQKNNKVTYYTVNVEFYTYNKKYYLIIPKRYLDNIKYLRRNKNDIFAKGKILTFTLNSNSRRPFSFDAVVDRSEKDPKNPLIVYAYFFPIKEKYRYSNKLVGNYTVKERSGDLTYQRMDEALDEFSNGDCCSENLEKYILGQDIPYQKYFNDIFNYWRYYPSSIYNYFTLNNYEYNKINKIFYNQMNTVLIKSKTNYKVICLMIYAIYQMRKNIHDKILICSSSNNSADTIALELFRMRKFVKKLNLLRIYAKNQEIIKRHELLDYISYHKLLMKAQNRNNFFGGRNLLIEKNDIIISTCVNSHCDEMINYEFPFVIIVDANNSNENENLIPITLKAKHLVLIAIEEDNEDQDKEENNENINLYKRMKHLYPNNHIEI